jgi:hypothetical protein
MRFKEFIRAHREQIDHVIRDRCSNVRKLNDDDRQEWIMNDEVLYSWAKSEGVKNI